MGGYVRAVSRTESKQRGRAQTFTAAEGVGRAGAGGTRWEERHWIAGVGVAAFAMFVLTLNGHPALGDSPETVAGVETWGVLHAPGYPSYVMAAGAFARLVVFGSMAFRVALFSAVCAAVTVVLAFVVVRRLGGERVPAAAGAAVLATGTSTWFYAGYEKHNAFTGLLVAVIIAGVLRWHASGELLPLLAAAVAGGLLVGGAWQMAAVCLPAVGIAVAASKHRQRMGRLALAAGVAIAVAIACYGYVLVRAGADPVVNWGRADSVSRLVHLVTMEDFGFTEDKVVSGAAGEGTGRDSPLANLLVQVFRYLRLLTYETTVLTLLAAGTGLAAGAGGRRRHIGPLVIGTLLATNIVVVAYGVGTGGGGFGPLLVQGGFLVAATFATAVGAGLAVSALMSRLTPTTRRGRRAAPASRAPLWAGLGLAAVLVVPAITTHAAQLERRSPDFARQYAANVLTGLPDDAVLLAWGADGCSRCSTPKRSRVPGRTST